MCACAALALAGGGEAAGAKAQKHAKPRNHSAPALQQAFTLFPIGKGNSASGVALGPDGNIWFTEGRQHKIARITPAGRVSRFAIPTPERSPSAITAGPDGNLWFTEPDRIGRITPRGHVTEFPIPPPAPTAGGGLTNASGELLGSFVGIDPYGITTGHDGNVWFTEWLGNRVGRITPSGAITEFPIPTAQSRPYGITAGREGNLWFVEESANKVARVTPSGEISEFPIPTAGSFPYGITAGRDGNLWFTEYLGGKIGRITPSGAITEFPTPTRGPNGSGSFPSYGITAGPEGNVYFTEESGNKLGRITPSGAISEFPIPIPRGESDQVRPVAIGPGPHGTLWFGELFGGKIVRVEPKLLGLVCKVPKLKGKTLASARRLLSGGHCTLGRVTAPRNPTRTPLVASQTPAANKVLPYGAKVGVRLR
jgi:streptogramin lyase